MAKRESKLKINKIQDNYVVSESEFEEGRTELTENQRAKVEQLSKLITGYYDNFINLPFNYSPRGLLDVIRYQFNIKENNQEVSPHEQREVLEVLSELRQLFGIE